jgi:LasA protease
MTRRLLLLFALLTAALAACTRSYRGGMGWIAPTFDGPTVLATQPFPAPQTAVPTAFHTPTRPPNAPILSPTPDPPRILPTTRSQEEQYVVRAGDSLGRIAQQYAVPVDQLVRANDIANPNYIEPGQVLAIPVVTPNVPPSSFKIIPDSELVYGPAAASLDASAFVQSKNGYLAHYQEDVDGVTLAGAQVVRRVAEQYSVNPRLLLAVLEYRSGWVLSADPDPAFNDYPLGYLDTNHKGLYAQLAWAANELSRGFYLWQMNAIATWTLADGSIAPVDPTINAGTAGVQRLMALLYGRDDWLKAVSAHGLFSTYQNLFGYPFDYAVEPLLPPDLKQPPLQLPFEPGEVWSFTGGPHGGWADGSAWAALDFAPPGDALGCVPSSAWVVAMADGLILRAQNGEVIEDLDGDGNEGTGWVLLYMHISSQDRVQPGAHVRAGDRIGHPSCEGGVSTGTHVHIARRYNGVWISADGSLPFDLDGWISSGDGINYDGVLTRNGQRIEAWEGRRTENQIQR